MTPTAEQLLILDRARGSAANLLINARAGAAKTTTLVLLAQHLAPERILSLAFNKKIADEMRERLPSNCESATLNALGHRAWGTYVGKRLDVDTKKVTDLLRKAIAAAECTAKERADLDEAFTDLRDGIAFAKQQGYCPAGNSHTRPLIGEDEFWERCETRFSGLERGVINAVLADNFTTALAGRIDFDDQVYLSAIMPVSFPRFPITMVDETQDLSSVNHAMLRKIVGTRRLIAVGDPLQAIYGFRGASTRSMNEMREMFHMEELYLTICFRSAESVVKNARWRAPDMQWRPDAPVGLVESLPAWSPATLADGDAIICRNNAPLFRMALRLLRAKQHPELASGDLIRGLLALMQKLGKASMPSAEALARLADAEESLAKRKKDRRKLADQMDCIRIFLSETETLGDAMNFLRDIASRSGRIKLMTGHKSKGLEFSRVFFLDMQLLRPDEEQDLNLRYVIETRAKEELRYVSSEAWEG